MLPFEKVSKKWDVRIQFPTCEELVESLGHKILASGIGTSHLPHCFYFVKHRQMQIFGVVAFNWSLYADCQAIEDFRVVRERIENDIVWFTSIKGVQSYLRDDEWGVDEHGQDFSFIAFRNAVLAKK